MSNIRKQVTDNPLLDQIIYECQSMIYEGIVFKNEAEANDVLNSLSNSFKIESVDKKNKQKQSKPPFTTSTMQQDASSKLNFNAKKTMQIAQKLYEGIELVEVTLKVVKPETSDNKEVDIKLIAPHLDLFASKVSDTFEQSTDECAEALQKQLIKAKEKKQ